jgi:hypothetical protein
VEFWEQGVDGQLVAPRRNRYTQRLPRDFKAVTTEVDEVSVRTLPLMAAPTVHECTFPVDVVLTWVDGRDPAWNAARLERLAGLSGTATTRESSGRARFVSRDELRYSLRSIHLFAPWVRRIHLVTAGQVPQWLDASHPQVSVVDHAAILPPEALPTFNSHAIESRLHRIPGLAEHFLYFNDDMFLGRPVAPGAFFHANGLAKFFPSPAQLEAGPPTVYDAPVAAAGKNNRRLLEDRFGRCIAQKMMHVPYPLLKSVLEEIERELPEEVRRTAEHQFRHPADLSIPSSLAHYWAYLSGRAVPGMLRYTYADLADTGTPLRLARLLSRRHSDVFCLNDTDSDEVAPEAQARLVAEFLPRYFPFRSPFELPDEVAAERATRSATALAAA